MIRNFINFFLILLFLLFTSCEKDDEIKEIDNRFHSTVYDSYKVETDIPYSNNVSQNGRSVELKLDLYYPEDSKADRPLIIYAHGGAFLGGNKSEWKKEAPFFAKSGYVVASIQYRLTDNIFGLKQAVIDASTDMKAAIRYFKNNASKYGIDIHNIFIGGYSAGAFIALQTAYVDNLEEVKDLGGINLLEYVKSHGGIEGDGGNSGSAYPIKGVFNISGAVGEISILNTGEPPLFSIHEEKDAIVPYGYGEVFDIGLHIGPEVYGSYEIDKALKELGVTSKLYTLKGNHNAIDNCEDCLVQLRKFIYERL